MTCCVVGPGLVGSYLGAAAGAGFAVAGPGGRVRAERVRLPRGERSWRPAIVDLGDACRSGGPLLAATRAHATPWTALPPGALAAQNGLGQPRAVATCFFALDLVEGAVQATGPAPRVVVGRGLRGWERVFAAWSDSGIHVEVRDDARPAQWEKAVLNATVGPLCLATGLAMAQVWDDPALRALTLAGTRDGAAIAAACGVALEPGVEARAERFFAAVGGHVPSVVRDPRELPWVLGRLLESAHAHGVAAGALSRIADLVAGARRAAAAG